MLKKAYSRYIKDKISASKFPEVFLNGKKLSRTECKEHTRGLVKDHPLTPEQLDKVFKEQGLGGSQTKTSQRKGIIATIFGQGKKKPTKEELREEKAAMKRRIAGSRYTAESDIGQLGGMAGQLTSRTKKSTLDRVLTAQASDEKGGKMIIGAGALNIQGKDYKVTAQGGGSKSSVSPSSGKTSFGGGYASSSTSSLGGNHGENIGAPKMPIGFGPKR